MLKQRRDRNKKNPIIPKGYKTKSMKGRIQRLEEYHIHNKGVHKDNELSFKNGLTIIGLLPTPKPQNLKTLLIIYH